MFTIDGQIVDLVAGSIFPGKVCLESGRILSIEKTKKAPERLICPPFVDSYVSIGSSLLHPLEFARNCAADGVFAYICDLSYVAGASGLKGVDFVLSSSNQSSFYFKWGMPCCWDIFSAESCSRNTNGINIKSIAIQDFYRLFVSNRDVYLSGLTAACLLSDLQTPIMDYISIALKLDRPISGSNACIFDRSFSEYADFGLFTDVEIANIEDAKRKMYSGWNVVIRSDARCFDSQMLLSLLSKSQNRCMFGTGHFNVRNFLSNCDKPVFSNEVDSRTSGSAFRLFSVIEIARRAISMKMPLIDVLRVATLSPVKHYRIDMGLLQKGDFADFLVIPEKSAIEVEAGYIKGRQIVSDGRSKIEKFKTSNNKNKFKIHKLSEHNIRINSERDPVRVLKVGSTGANVIEDEFAFFCEDEGEFVSDCERDILKMIVWDGQGSTDKPFVFFIHGFGLKRGAIASSNLCSFKHSISSSVCALSGVVALGANDIDIVRAVNLVVEHGGGRVLVDGKELIVLKLPIFGLLSDAYAEEVAKIDLELNAACRELGSAFDSTFDMLSMFVHSLKLRGMVNAE